MAENMIGISWFQVDWFKVQWIIFGLLVILIIILRVIRKLTRWGNVNIGSIKSETMDYMGYQLNRFFTDYSDDNKDSGNNVLFIPPYSMKNNIKNNHIAISLAFISKEVFVLPYKFLLENKLKHNLMVTNSHTDLDNKDLFISNGKLITKDISVVDDSSNSLKNHTLIEQLIIDLKIQTVIIFDWAIPIFLDICDLEKFNKLKLKIILIRPTFGYNEIKKLGKFFPFTGRWFYRMMTWRFISNVRNSINSERTLGKLLENKGEIFKQHDIILINPEKTWVKSSIKSEIDLIQLEISKISKRFRYISFTKGRWSFYRQETIVLGLIINSITAD